MKINLVKSHVNPLSITEVRSEWIVWIIWKAYRIPPIEKFFDAQRIVLWLGAKSISKSVWFRPWSALSPALKWIPDRDRPTLRHGTQSGSRGFHLRGAKWTMTVGSHPLQGWRKIGKDGRVYLPKNWSRGINPVWLQNFPIGGIQYASQIIHTIHSDRTSVMLTS